VACHQFQQAPSLTGKAQLCERFTLFTCLLVSTVLHPLEGPSPRSDHPLVGSSCPPKSWSGRGPTQGMVTATADESLAGGNQHPLQGAEIALFSPLRSIIHLSLKSYQRGDRITICVSRGKVLRVTTVSVRVLGLNAHLPQLGERIESFPRCRG